MFPGSVAQTVARGEYELGFQTMSELPVMGVDQFGPIPAETQAIQSFSAAIAAGAKEPAAGLALITKLFLLIAELPIDAAEREPSLPACSVRILQDVDGHGLFSYCSK